MDIKQMKLLAAAYEAKLSAEQIAMAILAGYDAKEDEKTFVARLDAMAAEKKPAAPVTPPVAAAAPAPVNAPAGISKEDTQALVASAVSAALKGDAVRRQTILAEAAGLQISAETVSRVLANPDMTLEAARGEFLKDVRTRYNPAISAVGLGGIDAAQNKMSVIEAAAYMGCVNRNENKAVKLYGDKVVEAASKLQISGFGELFEIAAAVAGNWLPVGHGINDRIRAAFSTVGLTDLLSNLANKALLEGYMPDEEVWPMICRIGSVRDFKKNSRHRLVGHFTFQQVGAGGELKHGRLSDQKFEIQADTQGITIVLTRQMIINDDLGAFLDLFRMLGLGAQDAINRDVWTLLEDNSDAFFHAANGNLPTVGGGNALALDSLTIAEKAFLDQKMPNDRPVRIAPKTLLVPTALKSTAENLMKSTLLLATTTANKPIPATNIHAGKFAVACPPDLTSATTWYLFADPNRLAALEVAFLNGQRNPTIEQATLTDDRLGASFRSYIDYGVAKQDPKGAVKMALS